jgi:hypothetical protein
MTTISKKKLFMASNGQFPNGFTSWHETHFEVVSAISREVFSDCPRGVVSQTIASQGTGGLYELAESLTDKFEGMHKGRSWDGEFFDEMVRFLDAELA